MDGFLFRPPDTRAVPEDEGGCGAAAPFGTRGRAGVLIRRVIG